MTAFIKNQNMKRLDTLMRVQRTKMLHIAKSCLRCTDDAEDALQEACARAVKTPSQFDAGRAYDDGGYEAWFTRILKNVCFEHHRRRARRPETTYFSTLPDGVVENMAVSDEPDPLAVVLAQGGDGASILVDAMKQLSPTDRCILEDAYFRGREERQIADDWKISYGAVRSRLMTARNKLRDALFVMRTEGLGEEV